MTLWEFAASVHGWSKANGASSGPPPPTDAEHAALMALYS
jgi:hypothetical protein